MPSLQVVPEQQWDRLGDPRHPFMQHAFLRGMEVSETVGEGTGWSPLYLLVTDPFDREAALGEGAGPVELPAGVRVHGAAASYVKTDSYGEFIFDWGWASFFHRHGVPYYPKLVIAAPFTPATGPRLLLSPDLPRRDREQVLEMLSRGMIALAEQLGASSVHWLFLPEEQAPLLAERGYLHRLTVQHAWVNRGYRTFDDFLATMKSRNRKAIRRERRIAGSHGLHIGIYRGDEMDDGQWQAVHRFYHRGCYRYGSTPYLTDAFFDWLRARFADKVLCCMARPEDPQKRRENPENPGGWVAATFNFASGGHLYGRYWGCEREWYALHFEMAFYRLIEHCIEHGWQRFEAGAGGRHKIKRGLEPVIIHSAHWIGHPQLGPAIAAHIEAESAHMGEHRDHLAAHSTRREGD